MPRISYVLYTIRWWNCTISEDHKCMLLMSKHSKTCRVLAEDLALVVELVVLVQDQLAQIFLERERWSILQGFKSWEFEEWDIEQKFCFCFYYVRDKDSIRFFLLNFFYNWVEPFISFIIHHLSNESQLCCFMSVSILTLNWALKIVVLSAIPRYALVCLSVLMMQFWTARVN